MTTSIKYMKQLRLLDLTYHTIPPTDEVTIERWIKHSYQVLYLRSFHRYECIIPTNVYFDIQLALRYQFNFGKCIPVFTSWNNHDA